MDGQVFHEACVTYGKKDYLIGSRSQVISWRKGPAELLQTNRYMWMYTRKAVLYRGEDTWFSTVASVTNHPRVLLEILQGFQWEMPIHKRRRRSRFDVPGPFNFLKRTHPLQAKPLVDFAIWEIDEANLELYHGALLMQILMYSCSVTVAGVLSSFHTVPLFVVVC